jgi:adenosylmethionine-8-amino-7-oxononanoate aminotransferase
MQLLLRREPPGRGYMQAFYFSDAGTISVEISLKI